MAKSSQSSFRWNPAHDWTVNIAALMGRRGGPASAKSRAKMSKSQKKRCRREKRERLQRIGKRLKARQKRQPRLGERNHDKVLRVMQPGEWYAWADIIPASGVSEQSLKYLLSRPMWRQGYLERAQDATGKPQRGSGRVRSLWRLTPLGELARALAIMLE